MYPFVYTSHTHSHTNGEQLTEHPGFSALLKDTWAYQGPGTARTLPSDVNVNKNERVIPIAGSFRALYLSLKASGVRVRLRSSLPIICPFKAHSMEVRHLRESLSSNMPLTVGLP